MTLLKVENLAKQYGGVQALSDVSFTVERDQFYSVIGPNGAGKSTLINLLTGLVRPSSGSISFDGQKLNAMRTHEIISLGIGRIFQNGRLFERLTVLENVMMGCSATTQPSLARLVFRPRKTGAAQEQIIEKSLELLEQFNLHKEADRQIGALSYGNRRLVEMAKVIASGPRLLLLDEPAAGLNSGEVERLMDLLRALRNAHKLSIVLIEHNMSMVMRLAERITVLNFGKKIAEGTPQEIQTNESVLKAYLGEGYKNVVV
jgi:branched-chain amino acid transport system ATP-binding protein